ncbi:MAG: ABC transporter permease [Candidatus Omnitrophica bacterium]|nr:ABC transporter permease [Candidatus Omnitrophota bacterium]
MKNRTGFRALVGREIQRFLSVFGQTILPPVVSSFLYIFIFGFSIGRSLQEVSGVSYLEFLIPGLIMMYLIEGSYGNASSSLFVSRWANHIQEILVTPLSYLEMVLAFLIGGLVRSVLTALGVYLVSLIFVRFPVYNVWIVLYFMIFVSLGFASVGLLVGLLSEEFEHISMWTTFVVEPLIFFGGVFHSMDMVPHVLKVITAANPIFYMVNGLRYGMIGVTDANIYLCMAVVMVFFSTLFAFSVYLFKIGYKLRV